MVLTSRCRNHSHLQHHHHHLQHHPSTYVLYATWEPGWLSIGQWLPTRVPSNAIRDPARNHWVNVSKFRITSKNSIKISRIFLYDSLQYWNNIPLSSDVFRISVIYKTIPWYQQEKWTSYCSCQHCVFMNKLSYFWQTLKARKQIVYCLSRKNCECQSFGQEWIICPNRNNSK
jgi:hypothetical protein